MKKEDYRTPPSKIKNYRQIKCSTCDCLLNNPLDMIIYNTEGDDVCEIKFIHHVKCDDKSFRLSRHVKEGFEDIIERYETFLDKKKQNESDI